MREDRPVTGAPYAATRVSTSQQTLANGTVITRQEQTQIYRDGQGRMRTEMTPQSRFAKRPVQEGLRLPGSRLPTPWPASGASWTCRTRPRLRPRCRSVATRRQSDSPPQPTARANPPSDPNLKEESLGTQFMNGVNATGRRITRTIPAGAIGNSQAIQTVEERWVSEDLKVPVMIKITDPRSGTRTETLNVTSRAEPDPSLFQAPAGFTVKTRQPGPGGRRTGAASPSDQPAQ